MPREGNDLLPSLLRKHFHCASKDFDVDSSLLLLLPMLLLLLELLPLMLSFLFVSSVMALLIYLRKRCDIKYMSGNITSNSSNCSSYSSTPSSSSSRNSSSRFSRTSRSNSNINVWVKRLLAKRHYHQAKGFWKETIIRFGTPWESSCATLRR